VCREIIMLNRHGSQLSPASTPVFADSDPAGIPAKKIARNQKNQVSLMAWFF